MNNSNLVEDYEQYKNNKNFIESNNFQEETKNMIFTVLEEKIDNKENTETEKNIEYFSTEELLEKLSTDNTNTLIYIKGNPESIKNIDDEDLKEIVLLFSNNLALHNSPVAVNFCYDIFHEKGNYEKLKNKLGNGLSGLIKDFIDFYSDTINNYLEIKNEDLLYYEKLIENNSIYGKVIEQDGQKYLDIKSIGIMGILPKEYIEKLIKFPEFFGDKEKYNKFFEALNISNKNFQNLRNGNENFEGIIGAISGVDYIGYQSLEALSKLNKDYSHIPEIKEYFSFLESKGNQMEGNWLWKVLLNDNSYEILNGDKNSIGRIIEDLMKTTIYLENDAKG